MENLIDLESYYKPLVDGKDLELLSLSKDNIHKLEHFFDCLEMLSASMNKPITINTYYGLFEVLYHYGSVLLKVRIEQPFCDNSLAGASFKIMPYTFLNYLHGLLPQLENSFSKNENK